MQKTVVAFLLLFCHYGFSQFDTINRLEEVLLYGRFSDVLQTGFTNEVYSDTILNIELLGLGNFLQKETNLYLKEYGEGMVSTISLRGSTASQTAVFWNGVPVNSSLNGQTDFNSLGINSFSQLEIKKGGGSVVLGSGAVGGSINFTDKIEFGRTKRFLATGYAGSYETFTGALQGVWSSNKFYAKISATYGESENDYAYPDTGMRNENGQYKNSGFQYVLGNQMNENNLISFFGSHIKNDRNLSGTLTAPGRSGLIAAYDRLALKWNNSGNRYSSSLTAAWLMENYDYFPDKNQPLSNENKGRNFVGAYDLSYFLNNNTRFSMGLDYNASHAEGDDLPDKDLDRVEGFVVFSSRIKSKLNYNLSARKGFASAYSIPFIFAVDARYKVSESLDIRANAGTNYRLPTFNDLYWQPGGNPDLKPEDSFTSELGVLFKKTAWSLDATTFLIKNDNLIQWVPGSADFWMPQNIQESRNYGVELDFEYNLKLHEHHFSLESQYTYVNAIDESTELQLIYNPEHKSNNILKYQYSDFGLSYHLGYTGKVYTTTSNTLSLDPYWLSDIHADYHLNRYNMHITFSLNNLFDQAYQVVAYRPMPGRNFNLTIHYQI